MSGNKSTNPFWGLLKIMDPSISYSLSCLKGQGFRDDSTKVLVIKRVMMGQKLRDVICGGPLMFRTVELI